MNPTKIKTGKHPCSCTHYPSDITLKASHKESFTKGKIVILIQKKTHS